MKRPFFQQEQEYLAIIKDGAGIGRVSKHPEKSSCLATMQYLIPREGFDIGFVEYFLNGIDFEKHRNGSTIPHIYFKDYKSEPFPILPLPEQKRIVAILDEAFAGIDAAIANTEKNLAHARELFESYLNAVFTQKGDGWVESSLGKSCEFFNGKAHEKKIDANGRFVVVNSKFIASGGVSFKRTNDALFPLLKDDIVMVMSDVPNGKALAKCFRVDEEGKYTLNQRICCIRSDKFDKRFLFYHLNRHPYLLGFNNGENQTNLRKGDILRCPLYIPEKSKQKRIAKQLDGMFNETQRLESIYQQKLDNLAELKQSILQKAFAGELTADVAACAEAVADSI